MKRVVIGASVMGAVLLLGTLDSNAENWVQNLTKKGAMEASYHDADSVKVVDRALNWTEKTVIASDRIKPYNQNLSKYEACKQNIAKKGEVTHHLVDYQIQNGKFRRLAKRNYNKDNELICTDNDMGKDYDKLWHIIGRKSSIENTYFQLVTKYKIKDL
jgi:hypothetical protein